MKPQSISEKMMYSTIRIIASNGSTGTGFFFEFAIGDKRVPIIITNKHVVNNNENEKVTFFLHTKKDDAPEENIRIDFNTKWFFHGSKDLCFCFANPLFEEIKTNLKKDVFLIFINEDLIQDISKLEELSAIEDVIMVGYPNGLWDSKNNLPLFRRGITSSHPAIDFNDENMGVVDMACFPGSSGSPIFILNENGYVDKKGTTHLGGKRLIFLGVLFSGPILSAVGEVVVEDILAQQKTSLQTPVMINLGYYIKSLEILQFKDIIQKML